MAAEDHSTFRPRALNHVALRVTDLARSRDFYREHVGAVVLSESDSACFLEVGGGNFIALFPSAEPFIEHFCLTVDDYQLDETAVRLEATGVTVHRVADRVFFHDPDGLLVQVSGPNPWPDFGSGASVRTLNRMAGMGLCLRRETRRGGP